MRTVDEECVELSVKLCMNELPVDPSDVMLRFLQMIHELYGVDAQYAAIIYPPADTRTTGHWRLRPSTLPNGDHQGTEGSEKTFGTATIANRPGRTKVSRNDAGKTGPPDLWQQLDIGGRGRSRGDLIGPTHRFEALLQDGAG